MPSRFTLYYWPIPYRAQFSRYILAYEAQAWDEPDRGEVMEVYRRPVVEHPLPFMRPPLLHDREGDVWLALAPDIACYLGGELGLMPGTPAQDAVALKVLNDCVDVLQELAPSCSMLMWTDEAWKAFATHRLTRWLQIFEAHGTRHGLTAEAGTLLGTEDYTVADLSCAALWVTICDTLPDLRDAIRDQAPSVMALSARIADTPDIAALRADQAARWGNVWCEGEIGASLRTVLANCRARDQNNWRNQ